MKIKRLKTQEATLSELAAIRALMDRAFRGQFTDDDWNHSLGGWHVVAAAAGAVVAHAALVHRSIEVDSRPFDTGYVEAVGVEPDHQGRRLGTAVMGVIVELINTHNELGALSTGEHHFYERLGWERWRGPTFVRNDADLVRTSDEDDGIMVLRFGPSADIDLTSAISCEARPGDDW